MNHPSGSLPPPDRATLWLRRRLGRAVVLSYLAALLLPGPGLWLRREHTLPLGTVTGLSLSTGPLLLALVLFSAGFQVPVRELGRLLRSPTALLAGLVLHLAVPLLVIPVVAFLLRQTPDADGGSGLVTAMILIVAMPVAAGATVWTDKDDGGQPTMVGLVLASTLLSPLTIPLVITTMAPLLSDDYADTLTTTGNAAHGGFALVGSLALTYVNASGALGSFLAHPRPLLFGAALVVAALVCMLSFALGLTAARLLRLDAPHSSSLTLACGMNNSSASAVLITTTLPDKPHLLLPVLVYGLLQKTAASRVVAATSRA